MIKKFIATILVLVCLSSPAEAATRLYLPSSGTPEITPGFDANWEKTTGAVQHPCSTTKTSTAISNLGNSENSSTTPYDVLTVQYISTTLDGDQTISGTVKGQIHCSESNSLANFMRAFNIYVVSGDGSTVRGVLLADFQGTLSSEFSTTQSDATNIVNRNFPPSTAVTSVNALDGDRIIIEIGFRSHNASTTSRTGRTFVGDDQTTDAAENETDKLSATNNAWVELSTTIAFDTASRRRQGQLVGGS